MTFDKIKEIIIDQLEFDEEITITATTSLVNDLGADSIDAVEVIMAIEDEFGIKIPDEDAVNFKNIGDMVKYVETKI